MRALSTFGLLSLGYFALAVAALLITRFDGGVAFLWIATPMLIAHLSHRSRRHWTCALSGCGIASFVATGLFGFGWGLALPFVAINLVEAYVGARLLRRARYSPDDLGSVPWLGHFLLRVGIVAPAVSAALVALTLGLAGRPAPMAAFHFFAGHSLSNVGFIPVMSFAMSGRLWQSLRRSSRAQMAEAVTLFGLVALITVAVFGQIVLPLLFLPMLPVMLVTFRLGQLGAATSIVIIALVGGGLTMAGYGPMTLVAAAKGSQMQFFQFYLAATVLAILPAAAHLRSRVKLHRGLRLSEQRYRLLADHSTDIVLYLGPNGSIRFVSPSIEQMCGYRPQDLVGTRAGLLVAPGHRERAHMAHLVTIEYGGRTHSFDYEGITRSGERRWFESHARAVIDEDGKLDGVLCFVRDVSQRKAIEQQLITAALTDPLTELPNRRAFREAVEQLLAWPEGDGEHSLAIFDIDHFKRVNDCHGHDAGDAVLRHFAALAGSLLRPGDRLFRIGGEEFAALLPFTAVTQALIVCERVRAEVAASGTLWAGQAIRVTTSGGVAVLGKGGIDAALRSADAALYRAKKGGRDQLYRAA